MPQSPNIVSSKGSSIVTLKVRNILVFIMELKWNTEIKRKNNFSNISLNKVMKNNFILRCILIEHVRLFKYQ